MLTDLDTAKEYFGITTDSYDDALSALLERISESIEGTLGWYFGPPQDTEEILDGTGLDVIHLRQPPTDEDALTVSCRTGVGDEWEEVSDSDFEVSGRAIYSTSYWYKGRRNIKVEYSRGFDSVPGDIEQLLFEIAGTAWATRNFSKSGILSETIGDYSYTRGSLDVTKAPSYGSVLLRWRRLRI